MKPSGESCVIAIFLVGLSASAVPAGSAHAEEDCLAAPSGPPPSGSQWRYRTDQVKQRKCWHLQPQGEKTETGTATTIRPAAERPKSPPDHLQDKKAQTAPETSAGLRGSTTPAGTLENAAGRAAPPALPAAPIAVPDKTVWPDPPAPAYAGRVSWPDSPMPIAADKAQGPEAPMLDRNVGSDAGSEAEVAAAVPISDDKTLLGIILIFAAALVVVGISVVRWIGRRSKMTPGRHVPRHRNVVASEIVNGALHDDGWQALQKLLQVLEQHEG
jgi:hypothetical protein